MAIAKATWRRRPFAGQLLLLWTCCVSGCAAYQIGAGTLYAPDISTVYVPMIEASSVRRDLGERLTEAVIKEIELKTPYKVVGTPEADSVLSVTLRSESRHVTAETAYDDPRTLELALRAEVTWLNRRRLPVAPPQSLTVAPDAVPFLQTAVLLPEAGQSVATSQQQAIDRLATQIVSAMEQPW